MSPRTTLSVGGGLYDKPSPCTESCEDEEFYKQLHVNPEVLANKFTSNGLSSVLICIQAYWVMMALLCKSYNDKMVEVGKFSQFQSSITSPNSFPKCPTCSSVTRGSCSIPLPMCRGCQGSSCMCKLLAVMFRRALGKLGNLGVGVKTCVVELKEIAKESLLTWQRFF